MPKQFGRVEARNSMDLILDDFRRRPLLITREDCILRVSSKYQYQNQVHWVKDNFDKTIRVNCTGEATCPGCRTRPPSNRRLVYAYNIAEKKVGILDIGQMVGQLLDELVIKNDETYHYNIEFSRDKNDLSRLHWRWRLTPIKKMTEADYKWTQELFDRCVEMTPLEIWGTPGTAEEWEIRAEGKRFNRRAFFEKNKKLREAKKSGKKGKPSRANRIRRWQNE